MNTYYHAGQFGDIAYSLPTVRALGPGKFITCLRRERHDLLEPLLRTQPYITDVAHDPHGRMFDWMRVPVEVTHDLNSFRKKEFGIADRTLVRAHGLPFGIDPPTTAWLVPPPEWKRASKPHALVARSFRYHNKRVNWPGVLDHLRHKHGEVFFVGTESEWLAFRAFDVRCKQGGYGGFQVGRTDHGLQWLRTPTLVDLAREIYEARYFAGNQSMPLALAIGLGVDHAVEVCPEAPNCSFPELPYQKRLG